MVSSGVNSIPPMASCPFGTMFQVTGSATIQYSRVALQAGPASASPRKNRRAGSRAPGPRTQLGIIRPQLWRAADVGGQVGAVELTDEVICPGRREFHLEGARQRPSILVVRERCREHPVAVLRRAREGVHAVPTDRVRAIEEEWRPLVRG